MDDRDKGLAVISRQLPLIKQQVSTKAKIAVVHPGLGMGGSESPVLWTLQALRYEYDATLITTGSVDLAALNAYYGTQLNSQDFSIRYAPLPVGLRNTSKFVGLKASFFHRYVQKVADTYDVMKSASCYGPMDFGRGVESR